jgi:pilus assembly protein FimV
MGALRRNYLCAWVSGAIIAVASLQSSAAGLGRLDVKSVLGEPLRADVTVLAKPGELQTLKVQLASPQAYEAVGLVHTLLISQLSVSLRQETGGLPIISITSVDPIDEPVLDLLLELTWASGRVTREYTAFIDPPFIVADRDKQRAEEAMAASEANAAAREQQRLEQQRIEEAMAASEADAAARAAEMQIEEMPSGAETQAATAPASSPTPEPLPEEPVASVAAQDTDLGPVETFGGTEPTLLGMAPTVSSSVGTDTADEFVSVSEAQINVVSGDTLSKIALANKPAGVTLNQMLVVLYRNNRQAFSGSNMNRLRTGKIIRLADPEEYRQIEVADATREVRAQTTSWKAYKQQLAAATVQRAEQLPQQAAGGVVTPRIQEPVPLPPPGTSPEVVKLSRGEPATAGQGDSQAASAAMQEQLVATEKALGESNERVTQLEKLIEDLEKLAEVQNQDMAELQSQAGTTAQPQPAPIAPQAGQPQPSQPPTAAKPDQASPNIQPGPDSAAPAKPGQPGQQAPVAGQTGTPAPSTAPPVATAKPPKTTPTTRKPRSRPQAQPPLSLLDRAFAQPYLLAIPVIVIALIGWGAWRLKGRLGGWAAGLKKKKKVSAVVGSAETASGSGAFSPDTTDIGFPGRVGESGEEVDPLEEAEIFLAYGRDAQAEELLQEAIALHPGRFEIHVKLLEIYAKQGNKEAFEKLARIIQQEAGSEGEAWDRVARLGYSIDPENSRYADGAAGQAEQAEYDQSASDITSSTDHLDFDVGMGDGTDQDAPSALGADIDLSDGKDDFAKTQVMSALTTDPGGESAPIDSDLNVDLPPVDDGASALDLPVDDGGNMLDFDIDSTQIGDQSDDSDGLDETATTNFDPGLEFNIDDISLGGDDVSPGSGDEEQSESADAPALDLSGISLDLDETTTDLPSASGKDDKWYEVQTKFDLAKAYQEMGDNDGAREILQEVISEGDSDQKVAAESVLSSLG